MEVELYVNGVSILFSDDSPWMPNGEYDDILVEDNETYLILNDEDVSGQSTGFVIALMERKPIRGDMDYDVIKIIDLETMDIEIFSNKSIGIMCDGMHL